MTYVRVVLALFLVTACATGASDGDAAMSDLDSGVPSDDGAVSDGAVSDGAVSEDGGDEDAGAADAAPPDSGPGDLCLGVDCSALDDACMVGTCDPADGSCAAAPRADGTACDDGDACTSDDACAAGVCGGGAVDCAGLDDACNVGVCDPGTGSCVAMPVADGTGCDDGDLCTASDACAAGVCAGSAVDCSAASDMCNAGVCDPGTGSCVAMPVADGTGCDDGSLCTVSDRCAAGTCAGSAVDCSGLSDMCNAGVCDPGTGSCVATPVADGTSCSDADLCTTGDVCRAGACGGTATDCSLLTDMCNVGSCDPGTGGCRATPVTDGTACDDGDPTTTGDACMTGTCRGTSCPDSDISGPWAYGYEVPVSRRTLTAPASLTLGDDQVSTAVPIGFTFDFFGTPYTSVYVGSNGWVSFQATTSSGCCTGGPLPSTTLPPASIALFWDDLDPPEGGTIRHQTLGTAPNRELVVEYEAIQHFPSGNPVTMQLVLHESSDEAEVICVSCPNDGSAHTQGVQNAARTFGYSMPGRQGARFGAVGDAVRYATGLSTGPDGVCDASDPCPRISSDPASAASSGGDRAVARPVPVNRRTLSAPTTLTLSDDQVSSAIPIGFPFTFFGAAYSDAYVGSNGWVAFATGSSGCCTGRALPSTSLPGPGVAAYWDDLNPSSGGTIRHQLLGAAPNREFVVEFDAVPHFGGSNPVTMQVVLRETTNEAELICVSCPSDGSNHTQGVQNAARSYGYAVDGREAASFSLTSDAVIFSTTSGEPNACTP